MTGYMHVGMPNNMFGGYRVGVDRAPNLSKSVLVKQYFRPDGSIRFTSEEIFMPPTDWVKKNKYAIITIMMKTIAGDLRNKYTDLHVEAHPRPGPNSVRLNIRRINTDESVIIDIRPGTPANIFLGYGTSVIHSVRQAQRMSDSNHYTAWPELFNKNKVARKKAPPAFTFALDDPRGTISLETWVDDIVVKWFYAETSDNQQAESVDNIDGSATP